MKLAKHEEITLIGRSRTFGFGVVGNLKAFQEALHGSGN